MRPGDTAAKAAWMGNPQGGVSAPAAVILPNPATRFRRTADRLDALAAGHPMGEWLAFLSQLSLAQHAAAGSFAPAGANAADIAKADGAGLPPLAADGYPRAPVWRQGLEILLDHVARRSALPDRAAAVIASLRDRAAPEALADDFLRGAVAPEDAGRAMFIAAALQVYFTHLAGGLDVAQVPLLPERGLCPCCGSPPVAGMVTASGSTPGVRYLSCSLCSTAWNHVRAVCITCGRSGRLSLKSIEGTNGAAKAETCDDCHTYAKMFYLGQDPDLDPYADDLASLGLDLMVAAAGWSRHAPNPLLLAR